MKLSNQTLMLVGLAIVGLITLGALYYYTREKNNFVVAKGGEPNKGVVLLVHSPHCGHCKAMMADWREFKKANSNKVVITEIDGSKDQEATQRLRVRGFPTIMWLPGGLETTEGSVVYDGDRTAKDIERFVQSVAY